MIKTLEKHQPCDRKLVESISARSTVNITRD